MSFLNSLHRHEGLWRSLPLFIKLCMLLGLPADMRDRVLNLVMVQKEVQKVRNQTLGSLHSGQSYICSTALPQSPFKSMFGISSHQVSHSSHFIPTPLTGPSSSNHVYIHMIIEIYSTENRGH